MMWKGVCIMIRASYVIPAVIVAKPYRAFHPSPDPGLQVGKVEKCTFRRDRELAGQSRFNSKEGRESFSQCYTRLLKLQDPNHDEN
jgi:hypothetical protein